MSVDSAAEPQTHNGHRASSLGTAAAKNLATTTKTPPQMQGITNRWVQHIQPWVEVRDGTYRVNRRLSYQVGDGRVDVTQTGDAVRIIPAELGEFPALRGYDDTDVLDALAGRFTQREVESGAVVAQAGAPVDQVYVVAHGRLDKAGANRYGNRKSLACLRMATTSAPRR